MHVTCIKYTKGNINLPIFEIAQWNIKVMVTKQSFIPEIKPYDFYLLTYLLVY